MSCRDTSGGSASLSLARARTGLPETELKALFHSLKREGAGLPEPTDAEIDAWRTRQTWLLKKAHLSERQRRSIEQRLFRSHGEPTPDGATFYAWSRLEGRALQEIAISSAKQAVPLAPPGSQFELYDFDENGELTRVWYASYGSNLFRERFLAYVEGGLIEGSNRAYWGCRDTTPPADDIPIRFDARPMFALESFSWGGGVAFMDAEGEGTGLGRAYLVTGEQFHDIVAQENGYRPGSIDSPLTEAIYEGSADIGNVMYGRLVHIGDHDGAPVVTFTGTFSTEEALTGTGQYQSRLRTQPTQVNRPSPGYVRMIGAGLEETFGLTVIQQADYIRGCPGGDQWSRKDLVTALRGYKLPEEIEEERRAAEAAKRRKQAEAARRAAEASRGHGWSFGSGYHNPYPSTLPLWSDDEEAARRRSGGGSISTYTKCDICGNMDWCLNRACDHCRRGGRGPASKPTQTPSAASLASIGVTPKPTSQPPAPKAQTPPKGKGKAPKSKQKPRQRVANPTPKRTAVTVVANVPDTTVPGWQVVTVNGVTQIRSASGRLYTEKEASASLMRLLDRQDDLYSKLRTGDPTAEEAFKDNQDAVQNYTEALAALQAAAPKTTMPPAPAAPKPKSATPKTSTTPKPARYIDPSRMNYPKTVPERPNIYIQPHLEEPVVRLPGTDLEFTQDEALEWLHEQSMLAPAHYSADRVTRLVTIVDRMETLRANHSNTTPRRLSYDKASRQYTLGA